MIPISVCIITKNEAENLRKCLEALKPYPFEVVVTDTGSADDSIAVAKEYTDRIYEFPWINDFSAARNFCAAKASHNVILSLDTDEFVRPFDWNALQEAVAAHPDSLGTIELFNYFDEEGETRHQICRLDRIFHRGRFQFQNPIHEALVPIGSHTLGRYDAPLSVDHVGYQGSPEKLREKAFRDITLIAAQIEADPENPYLHFQLGQSHMLMRDHDEALVHFRRAFALHPHPGENYTLALLCNYAGILLDLGQVEEAAGVLAFQDSFADHRDFLCLSGRIYLRMGQPLKALPAFVQALSATRSMAEDPRSPSFHIGLIYEMFGKRDIARSHYENCGADYPPAVAALARLVDAER